MAGSPTAAWLPKRPEQAPAEVSGPRFAKLGAGAPTGARATRPFRFGSEDRPDPDPPLGVGSVIGDRYQILCLLGEGGMGRVYEAQHIVLRRRVALKLLRRDAAGEAESLARFRQEALAASRIGAPEIVEVVDFASHAAHGGQQTYMVMELLAGESLEDWMDRPARLDEGLAILASLCDGLAAAHRAAVVHRDIKPANVFLPRADPTLGAQVRVKILDFGIAKITAGGEGFQTRQGSLLGTPYYLAPERVMGAELTGAADVYSVGVILYEMLTGNVPFVADSFMGILANHVHTPPLDPRQAAPDRPIPAAVAQLCLRLLSKDPLARPSAEAVAAELRALLEHDTTVLAAVETGPRGTAGAGADTQILADGTRELPLADRPTQPPGLAPPSSVASAEASRSVTKIGHTPAAGEAAVASSVVLAAASELPKRSQAGLWIGLVTALAAGGVALAVWLGSVEPSVDASQDSQDSQDSQPSEPVAEVERKQTPAENPEPGTTAQPVEAPVANQPEPEPPALEREPREPTPVAKDEAAEPSRRRKPKPKVDPKPPTEAEDEPAPAPSVEPPQPDPPAPTPEPGPELPTIKDDVYD